MKRTIFFLLLLFPIALKAQQISGVVKDESGYPLVGANVYIKGTYNGATTNADGAFVLVPESTENNTLVVSFIGYALQEVSVSSADSLIDFTLQPEAGALEEVVIAAGSFEAGDKKRAVVLSAIDVATTASSDGDIYGALTTFPGAQKQGETGKIIVRGGESHETKTYIDGMLVSSPYSSSMPDLPARGRFSPFMFNGIAFSTGGYSAEYGQALSSVLLLQTPGLFDEDVTSISLLNVGAGLGHTVRNERSAYSFEGFYSNLKPFFLMAQHDLDWQKVPEGISGNLMHRVKVGETGMIKTAVNYSSSASGLNYQLTPDVRQKVSLKNQNLFYNTTYNTELNDKWILKSGFAYNRNNDHTDISTNNIDEVLESAYSRVGLVNYFSNSISLKFGADISYVAYNMDLNDEVAATNYLLNSFDALPAGYFEADVKVSGKFAMRLGGRGEYSSVTGKYNLAPRTSLAYKVSKTSQFSVASGRFFQQAHHQYLKYNKQLNFERADHYLINYQYQKDKQVLRAEFYRKKYNNLITYRVGEYAEYEQLANNGDGYAQGVDVFWRDNKTLRNVDYWLSYSYIDSKRKFKDYPTSVTPDFVTAHNLSFVYKQWLDKIRTQLSMSYSFLSGRPYDSPYDTDFMHSKTKAHHDLSGNVSYIANIAGYFTVVHLSVSNLLGLENNFSYRYLENPEQQGSYLEMPVNSKTKRTIILGVFVSLK